MYTNKIEVSNADKKKAKTQIQANADMLNHENNSGICSSVPNPWADMTDRTFSEVVVMWRDILGIGDERCERDVVQEEGVQPVQALPRTIADLRSSM